MITWSSLKLFPHIHGYLFIFANTEIVEIRFDDILKYKKNETKAEGQLI